MAQDPEEILDRDLRYVWHPWRPATDSPGLVLDRGDGYYVWDIEGRRYLDGISSALNATCGHRHPVLRAAIDRQLDRLCHVDLSVAAHEPAGLLAERIAGLMPAGLHRTLFVNRSEEHTSEL